MPADVNHSQWFAMRPHLAILRPVSSRLSWPIGAGRNSFGEWMSRLSNFLVASVLLAFTLPLFLFIALAIKCESRGPIFERHRRMGPGARPFQLLTFRTTSCDPKDHLPVWARRRTRVGSFLFYTRIVGLPQLINLVRGDITLLQGDGWPSPFWD